MNSQDAVSSRVRAGVEFARKSGQFILGHFSKSHDKEAIQLESKRDGTPVTVADRDAESMLRTWIQAAFPSDGILGEEHGEVEGSSEYRWILDPIDGTASFICGVPLFGTLIGIEYRRKPVAGIINMPAMNELVWGGEGLGAWYEANGQPATRASVSRVGKMTDAVLASTSIDYFSRAGIGPMYSRLCAKVSLSRGWGDAYSHVLLATGRVDCVVEPLVKPWDIAPVYPIIHAAGGRCTDFAGEQTIDTGSLIATNGLLHEEVSRAVRGE